MTLMHATCIGLGDRGVLIAGPSGAGKSDLALRLIDRGAILVSDDQVILSIEDGRLHGAVPKTIAGKIEVRGLGIATMSYRSPMPIALMVDLGLPPDRMPEAQSRLVESIAIPVIGLNPFEASAPIKVEMALERWGLRA